MNEKKTEIVMKVLMDPGPPPDYDTAVVIKRNNFFPNVQRSQPKKEEKIFSFKCMLLLLQAETESKKQCEPEAFEEKAPKVTLFR